MAEMKAQLEIYQSELNNLHGQLTSYEDVETPIATNTSSRRKLLKRMAVGAIGGIGALGLAAATNSNYTVLAQTKPENTAIEATAGDGGYGIKAAGGQAPLFLNPSATAGSPAASTGAHMAGELYVDNAGNLFYCVTGGTPGAWRKLAGAATTGTSHLLPAPVRVVNTLDGSTGGFNGAITNSTKAFTIAGVSGIPANATAVFGNVSAFAPNFLGGGNFTATGALVVFPASADGAAAPNASTLNFGSPQTVISNSFTSGLISGKLGINVYTSARVTLDIAGYYL